MEDDLSLANELELLCRRWGYDAVCARSFSQIDREFSENQPDMVLMDVNLPYFDGFYWCERIREVSNVPVLFLSSRDQNADKMMAVAAGGDDYVEKPFEPELLLLKIRAMLRRAYEYTASDREFLRDGIYYENGQLIIEGRTVELTKSENRIVSALMMCKGSVVGREKLMQQLWNTDEFVTDASLTVLVSRLRAKLKEASGGEELIHTKKGIGYYME